MSADENEDYGIDPSCIGCHLGICMVSHWREDEESDE